MPNISGAEDPMKWAVIKVAHRCFRCLRKGHLSRCCERNPCSCGGGHHALLCKGQERSTNSAADAREEYFSGTAWIPGRVRTCPVKGENVCMEYKER